jgi:hypothetical protein
VVRWTAILRGDDFPDYNKKMMATMPMTGKVDVMRAYERALSVQESSTTRSEEVPE